MNCWNTKIKKKGNNSEILSLAFGSGSNLICSGSADSLVKIWNTKSRELIRTYKVFSNLICLTKC